MIFSLTALVIVLAAVEAVVRLGSFDTYFQNRFFTLNRALDYPDVFQKDRDLFWRLHPSQTITSRFFEGKTYRINSLGLRGDDVGPPDGKPRLLALGNSCTFGWGVSHDKSYVQQIENNLAGEFDVINGGVPGYSSLQGRRFFQNELIDLQPDIVTILFAWNDHWAAAGGVADKDQQFPPGIVIDIQNVVSHLHSYRLLKKLLLSPIESDPDSLFNRNSPVYRVHPDDYFANLKAICRLCVDNSIRPILLTSPLPSLGTYFPPGTKSNMHAYHEFYNEMVRRLAVEEQFELVDLARAFDLRDDLFDDASRDPIHFNSEGHRFAGELIADYLRGKK